MNYVEVFSALNSPFPYLFVLAGVATSVCLVVFNAFLRKIQKPTSRSLRWLLGSGVTFGALWSVVVGLVLLNIFGHGREALTHGSCRTIEGVVQDSKLSKADTRQSFGIGAERFVINEGVLGPQYALTSAHGGMLHDGIAVRLCVSDGAILRVEVRNP